MKKHFLNIVYDDSTVKKVPLISFERFVQVVDAYSLEDCPTVLEIGAYHGFFTKILSRNMPVSNILAVEADERVAKKLFANVGDLTNVKIFKTLIGVENKFVNFNVAMTKDLDSGCSTLSDKLHNKTSEFDISYMKKNVMSYKLSYFCDSCSLDSIDLLILDVLRSELDILESSAEILTRVNWIMLRRYNIVESLKVEGSPLFQDYDEFLRSHGFSIKFTVHRGKFFAFKKMF